MAYSAASQSRQPVQPASAASAARTTSVPTASCSTSACAAAATCTATACSTARATTCWSGAIQRAMVEVVVVFRVGSKEFRQSFFDVNQDVVDDFIGRIQPENIVKIIEKSHGLQKKNASSIEDYRPTESKPLGN